MPLAVAAGFMLVAIACNGGGGGGTPDATIAPQACSPPLAHPPGETNETLTSGGMERTYLLRVPPAYDGSQPAPLVLAFHSFGQNGALTSAHTALGGAADTRGWIVVFPDGTGSPAGWNAFGPGTTGSLGLAGVDDAQFVQDLLAHLEATLCIDGGRVYAAGYSIGGGMVQRVACDLAGRIAAIATVAAIYLPCQADAPMIAFHGSQDPQVPYEGGVVQPSGITVPPVQRAVTDWARGLGCDEAPTVSSAAADVELSTYEGCTGGDGQVLLYTVLDGGHAWPGPAFDFPAGIVGVTTHSISATDLMLAFFEAHSGTP